MSDTNEREPINPNDKSRVTTGIPHSGVHHDENPVNVFDKTSLEDAHTEGLINPVPNTVEGLGAYRPHTYTQEETVSPFKRHLKKIIAVGALATVAIGIGVKEMTDKPEKAFIPNERLFPTPTSAPANVTPNEVPSETPIATPESNKKAPEIMIADSDNPNEVNTALSRNFEAAFNTHDSTFLEFYYADITRWSKTLEALGETAAYKREVPMYRYEVISKVVGSQYFGNPEAVIRILKLEVEERDIDNVLGSDILGRKRIFTQELTLRRVEKELTVNGRTRIVRPWLVVDSESSDSIESEI